MQQIKIRVQQVGQYVLPYAEFDTEKKSRDAWTWPHGKCITNYYHLRPPLVSNMRVKLMVASILEREFSRLFSWWRRNARLPKQKYEKFNAVRFLCISTDPKQVAEATAIK